MEGKSDSNLKAKKAREQMPSHQGHRIYIQEWFIQEKDASM